MNRVERLKRVYAAVATVAMLTVLAGCPQPSPDGGGGDGGNVAVVVTMQNIAFNPVSVTIQRGQTVRWVNNDLVPHTVTSGSPGDAEAGVLFDSGTLGLGATFDHTFEVPGTYVYFCRFHPVQMRNATVVVQ